MKKIYLFGTALLSILSTAGAWAQAEITISGEKLEDMNVNGYSLNLGESNLTQPVVQTIHVEGFDLQQPITIQPEGSSFFTAVSVETAEETRNEGTNQTITLTPDVNGHVDALVTFRSLTESEILSRVAEFGITSIEDLLKELELSYGDIASEPWGVVSGSVNKFISVSLNILENTEETPSDIHSSSVAEGISYDGIQIINPNHVGVSVYNVAGQLVAQSYKNINMSVYPAGVYVIKATNGASIKIVK